MDDLVAYFKVKKNLINLLLLAILVLGIPIGINLIRNNKVFFSKAAVPPIQVEGVCVKNRNGNLVATCKNVDLKLTSPLGGPAASQSASQ